MKNKQKQGRYKDMEKKKSAITRTWGRVGVSNATDLVTLSYKSTGTYVGGRHEI